MPKFSLKFKHYASEKTTPNITQILFLETLYIKPNLFEKIYKF
jgi:hypothetical protein